MEREELVPWQKPRQRKTSRQSRQVAEDTQIHRINGTELGVDAKRQYFQRRYGEGGGDGVAYGRSLMFFKSCWN